jgi:D-tyrosyl-tRNA(Tyr) deacylase
VLLGVGRGDTEADADVLCRKVVALRVFEDAAGKFAHSLADYRGALLVVSQFTLYGDVRGGRRPSFTEAAPAEQAETLYTRFVERARADGVSVASGRFRAHMALALVNDGPVTLVLDSAGNV